MEMYKRAADTSLITTTPRMRNNSMNMQTGVGSVAQTPNASQAGTAVQSQQSRPVTSGVPAAARQSIADRYVAKNNGNTMMDWPMSDVDSYKRDLQAVQARSDNEGYHRQGLNEVMQRSPGVAQQMGAMPADATAADLHDAAIRAEHYGMTQAGAAEANAHQQHLAQSEAQMRQEMQKNYWENMQRQMAARMQQQQQTYSQPMSVYNPGAEAARNLKMNEIYGNQATTPQPQTTAAQTQPQVRYDTPMTRLLFPGMLPTEPRAIPGEVVQPAVAYDQKAGGAITQKQKPSYSYNAQGELVETPNPDITVRIPGFAGFENQPVGAGDAALSNAVIDTQAPNPDDYFKRPTTAQRDILAEMNPPRSNEEIASYVNNHPNTLWGNFANETKDIDPTTPEFEQKFKTFWDSMVADHPEYADENPGEYYDEFLGKYLNKELGNRLTEIADSEDGMTYDKMYNLASELADKYNRGNAGGYWDSKVDSDYWNAMREFYPNLFADAYNQDQPTMQPTAQTGNSTGNGTRDPSNSINTLLNLIPPQIRGMLPENSFGILHKDNPNPMPTTPQGEATGNAGGTAAGGTTGNAGGNADGANGGNPPPTPGYSDWFNENKQTIGTIAAGLLTGGLILALGGNSKQNSALMLLLALLGGGAASWFAHSKLAPEEQQTT